MVYKPTFVRMQINYENSYPHSIMHKCDLTKNNAIDSWSWIDILDLFAIGSMHTNG